MMRALAIGDNVAESQSPVKRQIRSDVAGSVVIWQPLDVNFAGRVAFALKRSGKTQMQAEVEAPLAKGSLSRVLDGKRGLSRTSTAKLARCLGVSFAWLASGEGEPEAKAVTTEVDAREPTTLDELIEAYDWPGELPPELARAVVEQLRGEHFKNGEHVPFRYFANRLPRLVAEALGRAKDVHQREPVTTVDLTQESEEIRAARKRPKKL